MPERFTELANEACEKKAITIHDMSFGLDYVYMSVSAPPDLSPLDVLNVVKGATAKKLSEEFQYISTMTGVWTRHYYVSTGKPEENAISEYVLSQKNRP